MKFSSCCWRLLALVVTLSSSSSPSFVGAFQPTAPFSRTAAAAVVVASKSPLFSSATSSSSSGGGSGGSISGTSATDGDGTTGQLKTLTKGQLVRREGGPLSFSTKYGALNPFAIYYGVVAIGLGIPWFLALKLYQFFQFVTRYKFDKNRRIPSFLNHVWGVSLMRLTRSYPIMENTQILKDFYKEKRPAMFVANHNSWMDIPFMGATIGWRNYKFVAKKELEKVPILSAAIKIAGNLMVDRKDKKSGLKTLRTGIDYMKEGLHLCTFPEGTRSRDGRVRDFKNGAFKMAHKAGAPVIPLSIVGAEKVQPPYWMFPMMASRRHVKVIIHKPIESKGLTEEELASQVRQSMIDGLPEENKPLVMKEQ